MVWAPLKTEPKTKIWGPPCVGDKPVAGMSERGRKTSIGVSELVILGGHL